MTNPTPSILLRIGSTFFSRFNFEKNKRPSYLLILKDGDSSAYLLSALYRRGRSLGEQGAVVPPPLMANNYFRHVLKKKLYFLKQK